MNQNPHSHEAPVIHVLPNGLTVCLERLPYLHSASAGVWVRAGSSNEADNQTGISHFLEHLFFKGTVSRTTHDIMEAIEGRGGHLNAFTSRDYTCLYAKTLDTHVSTSIEILSDIVKNSTFNEMEKERNVILEEITSIEDVPEDYVHDLFSEHIWPAHPLGRPVGGTQETVDAISLDDIRAYYQSRYRPDCMIVSVAGNFDETQALEQIASAFGDIPASAAGDNSTAPTPAAGANLVRRDIGQDHICFGFPGTHIRDSRRYTYELLSSILGGGSTSRLFERIREEEGLAYSIYSFFSAYWRAGFFGVYAAVAPENLEKTLDLTFEELRKLRDVPVDATELNNNREQLKGGLLISLEGTFHRMARMARSMMSFGRIVSIDEIIQSIDNVTAEDIQQLACEMFDPGRCAMTVLGPVKKDANVQFRL